MNRPYTKLCIRPAFVFHCILVYIRNDLILSKEQQDNGELIVSLAILP